MSPFKTIFNNNKESYNEALYDNGYINELEYLDANNHHINRGNDIGNKGKNYRGNNRNNNLNMDNEISKNSKIKTGLEIFSGLILLFTNSLISI